jgi:small subunit ribosomal protein S17
MEPQASKNKHTLVGEVVSDKMDKTIVVQINRDIRHPDYHKVVRRNKKYKVHDEQEKASVGDVVEIYEGRPTSKTKYMYLSRIIKSAGA